MSDQNQSGNQSQVSSDNQTNSSNETTPPKPQAVEPKPKPEPSFGIEKFSDPKVPSHTFEKRDKTE